MGYAIRPDGDIISVHRTPNGIKGMGEMAVIDAIERGGRKLDAFGKLKDYYERFGFKEVKRIKWNDKYAPPGWNYKKWGRPDVVYMKLDKDKYAKYLAGKRKISKGDGQAIFDRNYEPIGRGISGAGQRLGLLDRTYKTAKQAGLPESETFSIYAPSVRKGLEEVPPTIGEVEPFATKKYRGLVPLKEQEAPLTALMVSEQPRLWRGADPVYRVRGNHLPHPRWYFAG